MPTTTTAPAAVEVYTVRPCPVHTYEAGASSAPEMIEALVTPEGKVRRFLGRGTSHAEAVEKATEILAGWITPRLVIDARRVELGGTELVCSVGE